MVNVDFELLFHNSNVVSTACLILSAIVGKLLIKAALKGNIDYVEKCIAEEVDPNYEDDLFGETAIIKASRK